MVEGRAAGGIGGARGARALLQALALLIAGLLGTVAAASGGEPIKARDLSLEGDAARMRLALNFDGEPSPNWFLLRAPYRLAIDLADTTLLVSPEDARPRGFISSLRYGALDKATSRLLVGATGPFVIERADILKNEGGGYRLVMDLAAAPDAAFEAALAVQAQTTGATVSTDKGDRVAAAPVPARPAKRFTVVVDPGHGGIDGGAEGLNGTEEKTVTSAFATALRDRLAATGRYDVSMTRESDEFLRLDDRVRIARQRGADLFISIHADTIRQKGVRGATVYTVSDRASDAQSQALADRENLSDQLAGLTVENEKQEVADILVDLIRRETHSFSIRFARALVGELGNSVGLIKNPHRMAGFKVLKAPDVPSVLIELGYLSNKDDEAQLLDPDWRAKAVASIAAAVESFAGTRVGG